MKAVMKESNRNRTRLRGQYKRKVMREREFRKNWDDVKKAD